MRVLNATIGLLALAVAAWGQTAQPASPEALAKERRADKRLIFSALIVPVLIVLLQVYLSSRGAGS